MIKFETWFCPTIQGKSIFKWETKRLGQFDTRQEADRAGFLHEVSFLGGLGKDQDLYYKIEIREVDDAITQPVRKTARH